MRTEVEVGEGWRGYFLREKLSFGLTRFRLRMISCSFFIRLCSSASCRCFSSNFFNSSSYCFCRISS